MRIEFFLYEYRAKQLLIGWNVKGHFSFRKVALADFRRIYGVVFRTSLHGEATDYLLIIISVVFIQIFL